MNRSKFDKKEGSEMNDVGRLRHSVWECKYHLVWIPKCRRKVLYGQLRRELGEVFHELARQKECRIEEGHLLADHVHVLMSIPPKYAVAQVVGFVKGKSAIHIARSIGRRRHGSDRAAPGARHVWRCERRIPACCRSRPREKSGQPQRTVFQQSRRPAG